MRQPLQFEAVCAVYAVAVKFVLKKCSHNSKHLSFRVTNCVCATKCSSAVRARLCYCLGIGHIQVHDCSKTTMTVQLLESTWALALFYFNDNAMANGHGVSMAMQNQ